MTIPTTQRDVAVLVNPERTELADEVLAGLEAIEARRLTPSSADKIADCAREAAEAGADTVVAIGGDGTQRSVAAGLINSATALGVIPGGTVNLLAQVLGCGDLTAALTAIDGGDRRAIDVGTCNGEVFVLNSSSGYDAAVIAAADAGHKARFGRLTFVRAAVSAFHRTRPRSVTVTIDGDVEYTGRAMSVIVTNVAERSSADLRIAPAARFDDGELDVMIVRAATPWKLIRLGWTLIRRRTPRPRDLVRATGAEIDVSWSSPVHGQIDGDPRPQASRFTCRVVPGALSVHA